MSYGGFPRDYKLPTVDPDKEDETEAEKRKGYKRINYGKYSNKTYSYKDLKKAWEEGYNSVVTLDENGKIPEDFWGKRLKPTSGKVISVHTPKTCNHKWVPYHGLIETYHFCEHCDEKRK